MSFAKEKDIFWRPRNEYLRLKWKVSIAMKNQTDKKNIKRKNMHPLPQENQKQKQNLGLYSN